MCDLIGSNPLDKDMLWQLFFSHLSTNMQAILTNLSNGIMDILTPSGAENYPFISLLPSELAFVFKKT